MHAFVKGSHPPDAADTLLETSRRPWNVEMDYDARILEIDSFTQQIRRKKEIDSLSSDGDSTRGREWGETGQDFVAGVCLPRRSLPEQSASPCRPRVPAVE